MFCKEITEHGFLTQAIFAFPRPLQVSRQYTVRASQDGRQREAIVAVQASTFAGPEGKGGKGCSSSGGGRAAAASSCSSFLSFFTLSRRRARVPQCSRATTHAQPAARQRAVPRRTGRTGRSCSPSGSPGGSRNTWGQRSACTTARIKWRGSGRRWAATPHRMAQDTGRRDG